MCREGTSFSNSGDRIQASRETEVFTLSKRYLMSDFSSSLWYAVFVYSIIEAAVRGEPDAVRMALRCYSGYIAVLSKRTIRDKRGFSQLQMDIDLFRRLERKLLIVILQFYLD